MIASNHDTGTVTLHCWLLNITNPSFYVAIVIIAVVIITTAYSYCIHVKATILCVYLYVRRYYRV